MEKVNSSIKMEVIIKDNGKTTKCMDGVNYSTKEEDQLIKGIGVMINFMDMEKFTMIIQFLQTDHLTILILICQMIIGFIIKVLQSQILNKEEEK